MREWESEFLGLLASKGDDLGDLRRAELGATAGAVVVTQHIDDEGLELDVSDGLELGGVEHVCRLHEPCAPTAHALLLDAHRFSLLKANIEVDGDKDDLRSGHESVLDGRRSDQPLKNRALAREKTDGGGASRHAKGMIQIAADGNHRQSCPAALDSRSALTSLMGAA